MPTWKGRQAGQRQAKAWARVAQGGAAKGACAAGKLGGWAVEGKTHYKGFWKYRYRK